MRPIALALLVAFAAPASAAPVLTAPAPVDAPLVAPSLGHQQRAAVAFGAGHFLAVYSDGERGVGGGGPLSVRAVRFTAAGTVLDDPPLTIAAPSATNSNPAVAFDGTRFFVVWSAAAMVAGGGTGIGVWGAFVDAAGAVSTPFSVVAEPGQEGEVSISAGDGWALPCWSHLASPVSLVVRCSLYKDGAIHNGRANVLVSSGLTGSAKARTPSVAYGGAAAGGFLVAYEVLQDGTNPTQLHAAIFAPSGASPSVQLNTSAITGGPALGDPTVASDGTRYLVYWADLRDTGLFELWSRAVSFAGVPGASDALLASSLDGDYRGPQALYAGGRFFLSWEFVDMNTLTSTIMGGRYDETGVGDGNGYQITQAPGQAERVLPSDRDSLRRTVAADNLGHVMTVWSGRLSTQRSVTESDVFALPTDLSQNPVMLPSAPSLLVSRARNYQRAYRAASNGAVVLVVWEDDRNVASSGVDVLGRRYGVDGAPMDTAPFPISTAASDQITPAVGALPGGDFLVAWSDGRDLATLDGLNLYGTRVSSAGQVKDPQGVAIVSGPKAHLSPVVSGTPTGWVVAWEDWRHSDIPVDPAVYVRRVAPDGTLGGESLVELSSCAPAAAYNGKQVLVAFERPCSQIGAGPSDVGGHWVSSQGVVNSSQVQLGMLADAETAPALASDGSQIFAAWRSRQGTNESIVLAAVADGAQSPKATPLVMATGAGVREAPALGAATGGNGLLAWVDGSPPAIRARRFDSTLASLDDPFEVGNSPFRTDGDPSADVLHNGLEALFKPRFTPPPGIAVSPDGQALVATTLLETLSGVPTPRVYVRKLGLVDLGGGCTSESACALGICTRGACCDTTCDGLCQACGNQGCVAVPAADTRCPAVPVSCAALSTTCRTFTDPPPDRCVAFGECASSTALSECTTYSDAADGTTCDCGDLSGSCSAGACLCASTPVTPFMRALPAQGCAMSGGARGGGLAVIALVLLVLALRRRALLALLLVGCGGSQTALELTLHLDDPVLVATDHARLVISSGDRMSFPASAPLSVKPGLTISNYDADGDGRVDAVLELARDYHFRRDERFRLLHEPIMTPVKLSVRAEVFDGLQNRFAQASAVQAVLSPGSETRAGELSPRCMNDCTDGTWRLAPSDAAVTIDVPLSQAAVLGSGNLSGAKPARIDLALASPREPLPRSPSPAPNAGAVAIYPGSLASGALPATIMRGAAGDALGSSLVIADLDGDGADDLAIGAPGANDSRGAVFVIFGGTLPAELDLGAAALPARTVRMGGLAVGDRLGSALAAADADGNGQPDLIIGAEGASTVYVAAARELMPIGTRLSASALKSIIGKPGSRFGAALAALGQQLAIGAPAESDGTRVAGAAYVAVAARDFSTPGRDAAGLMRWTGQGGGFGQTVELARLDGSEAASLLVAAPESGGGTVLIAAADAPLAEARRIEATTGIAQLGASLRRLPWPGGDGVVVGAPARLSSDPVRPGAAVVVRAATLRMVSPLRLAGDAQPAAAAVTGVVPGGELGSALWVADFDLDGLADLAVASRDGHTVHVFRGPIL